MRNVAAAICAALGLWCGAAAGQEGGSPYVVTYLESLPARAADVRDTLRKVAAADAAGRRAVLVLERTDKPHHYALLETGAGAVEGSRATLAPMLTAPLDSRPHAGLATGEAKPGAIVVLTHVDIVPDRKDIGIAALRKLAEESRSGPGIGRFDVLQQNSRPNHFTLVETWADREALEGHIASPHMRAFREALMPMSGSLYDERLYRVVE